MNRKPAIWLLCGLVFLVGACSHQPEQRTAQPHRISPIPEPAPTMPAGTFDRAAGQAELATARAAQKAGNLAQARTSAEASVGHWPGNAAAWQALADICAALKDNKCKLYAGFFGGQVAFLNPLPPRVGMLGFQNVAAKPIGTSAGSYVYDQRTLDTARRLEAFYNNLDPLLGRRWLPGPGTSGNGAAGDDQSAPDPSQSDSSTSDME